MPEISAVNGGKLSIIPANALDLPDRPVSYMEPTHLNSEFVLASNTTVFRYFSGETYGRCLRGR